MRQILLFAALAASLALLSGCALSKAKADTAEDITDKAAYQKISAEEAYEMMASQEVVVVDVRTREEYDGGHIENAVLIPHLIYNKRCTDHCRNSGGVAHSLHTCFPVSFLMAAIVVYIIRRLKIDYAWGYAIGIGSVLQFIILVVCEIVFKTEFNIVLIVIGVILGALAGYICNVMFFPNSLCKWRISTKALDISTIPEVFFHCLLI
mgnify:CR=1 FL=1